MSCATNDQILIRGLRVQGVIGVYDFEQKAPRELVLNLALHLDLSAAAVSDDLDETIDYALVADIAQQLAREKHHALLEHFGGRLIHALFDADKRLQGVDLEIQKAGAVDQTEWVGVKMSRIRA